MRRRTVGMRLHVGGLKGVVKQHRKLAFVFFRLFLAEGFVHGNIVPLRQLFAPVERCEKTGSDILEARPNNYGILYSNVKVPQTQKSETL